jgi:Ca-activated chloride channel family protein
MSMTSWMRPSRVRRGVASTALILAAGGLILYRTAAASRGLTAHELPTRAAPNAGEGARLNASAGAASFAGPGAHGTVALSHAKVLAGGERQLYLEVRVSGDASAEAKERAPLSLAVVLDRSGSMDGDKLEEAKRSVIQLVRDMRDTDEIAVVTYDDASAVLQPLARVGDVRASLVDALSAIRSGGGTAIPKGLDAGIATLRDARKGRVRRVVLVSDGLDATRAEAERTAQQSFEAGVTTSSLGIGLDFDESYLGALARAGHGNFGFVKDASSLSAFLGRELRETALTTVQHASVHLKLPKGVRFVRALGGDATSVGEDGIDLKLGALFAGDERRALVQLAANLDAGDVRALAGTASWTRVGGSAFAVDLPRLEVAATNDAKLAEESRNGAVFASVTSVLASERQLAAADAYSKGDTAKADALVAESVRDLGVAPKGAPPMAKAALDAQKSSYEVTKRDFGSIAPTSTAGRAMTKSAAAREIANVGRSSY